MTFHSSKIGFLLSVCLLLCGCNTYNNFRAYYNTYYNAKKSFRAGLEKVRDQPVKINPAQFIQIHPSPLSVSEQSFKEAIDNAAQILRRFPESKWADNALFLIGKSYYYRQKYFPALQKFEALLNLPQKSELKSQAILWKARIRYETGLYQSGVNFLREKLATEAEAWPFQQKAKVKTVYAGLLAKAGRIQEAADTLRISIPYLDSETVKARSYFLLGQLYMRLKKYNKAYQSFSHVGGYNSDYVIIYYAKIKAAQSAGLGGHTALAVSIYEQMLDDDKNVGRQHQIYFQLGQLAEQSGNYKKAEDLYKQVLRLPVKNNLNNQPANTYYQLAQLYSRHFNNYKLATAYFDSSEAVRTDRVNAEIVKKEAYGRYISLKAKISRIDRLLWLGSLSPEALDSVITAIKVHDEGQLRRRLPINNSDDNMLTNVNIANEENSNQTYSAAFGFLNYRNDRLVAQNIQQFQSVWGNRPLVDNWRRIEAVAAISIADQESSSGVGRKEGINKIGKNNREQKNALLSEVPIRQQEKKIMREQKLSLQYRLANLFFLTLDKPDSAAIYFKKVVKRSGNQVLIPKALFSLYQLYKLQEQTEKAKRYRNIILDEYSGTIFASRLKGSADSSRMSETRSKIDLRKKIRQILSDTTLTDLKRAKILERLSLSNKQAAVAAYVFYQSIRQYIEIAKGSAGTVNKKYVGKYWEKVRAMTETFQKLFSEAPQNKQVAIWEKTLKSESQILTCRQIGAQPKIAGGMQAFLANIELPQKLKGMNLSGSLTYKILINKKGAVESYELESKPTGMGIEEAYSKTIESYLQFEPFRYKGEAVRVRCEVVFPVKLN